MMGMYRMVLADWLGLVCQNPFLNELAINTVGGEKMLENTIKLGIPSLRNKKSEIHYEKSGGVLNHILCVFSRCIFQAANT